MSENDDKNLKNHDSLADSETDLLEIADPVIRLEKRQEEASYRKELRNELKLQEIEDRKSNRELREKYADKMFRYMRIWSSIVIFILVLSGFQFLGFQLDKWVLITLIGSTTVSVFAIVRAIIEGLFKSK